MLPSFLSLKQGLTPKITRKISPKIRFFEKFARKSDPEMTDFCCDQARSVSSTALT
jgi:hypothetical protein